MNESKSKSISLSAVLALSLAGWLAGKKTLVLRVFIAIPYKCICSLPAFHLLIGPTQSRDSLPRDPTPGHGRPTTLVNRTSDDETPSRQQQPVSSPDYYRRIIRTSIRPDRQCDSSHIGPVDWVISLRSMSHKFRSVLLSEAPRDLLMTRQGKEGTRIIPSVTN